MHVHIRCIEFNIIIMNKNYSIEKYILIFLGELLSEWL